LADARAQDEYRQRCALALLTPGEVGLEHFAGLDGETAAVLFDALQLALQGPPAPPRPDACHARRPQLHARRDLSDDAINALLAAFPDRRS
jgi:hypothetical protein